MKNKKKLIAFDIETNGNITNFQRGVIEKIPILTIDEIKEMWGKKIEKEKFGLKNDIIIVDYIDIIKK